MYSLWSLNSNPLFFNSRIQIEKKTDKSNTRLTLILIFWVVDTKPGQNGQPYPAKEAKRQKKSVDYKIEFDIFFSCSSRIFMRQAAVPSSFPGFGSAFLKFRFSVMFLLQGQQKPKSESRPQATTLRSRKQLDISCLLFNLYTEMIM